jgi:hypothetical protein
MVFCDHPCFLFAAGGDVIKTAIAELKAYTADRANDLKWRRREHLPIEER